jgi:integrase
MERKAGSGRRLSTLSAQRGGGEGVRRGLRRTRQIARELNFEEVPALRGGQWYASQVKRVLTGETKPVSTPKRRVQKMQLAWNDYLTVEQVRQIGERLAVRPDLEILFWFMVGTGLRRAEVAAIRAGDIDLVKHQVTVRRGKGAKARTVIIGPALCRRIEAHMKGRRPGKRSAIFCDREGCALREYKVTWRVEMMRKIGGIDWLHPHVLRHTFATLLYNYRQDIIFVQNQLGHKRLETAAIYAKTYEKSGYEQMAGLDSVMGL